MLFGFIGTKEQCENSAVLIEKSNNINKEQEELESDSSNHLTIDEQTEKSDDENNYEQESGNEDGTSLYIPTSQQADGVTNTHGNIIALSKTTLVNNQSSSSISLTTDPSFTSGKSLRR